MNTTFNTVQYSDFIAVFCAGKTISTRQKFHSKNWKFKSNLDDVNCTSSVRCGNSTIETSWRYLLYDEASEEAETWASMIGPSQEKSNLQGRNEILRRVVSMFPQLGRLHWGLIQFEWKNNCFHIDYIPEPPPIRSWYLQNKHDQHLFLACLKSCFSYFFRLGNEYEAPESKDSRKTNNNNNNKSKGT